MLDAMEDLRPLTAEETKEWKTCRDEVAEVDIRIEMEWRQHSRQLWLSTGDANTHFFHQMANRQCRLNGIRRLRIGGQVINVQAIVSQAFADHFRAFYRWGLANRRRWLAIGASALAPCQQQQLILPLSMQQHQQMK